MKNFKKQNNVGIGAQKTGTSWLIERRLKEYAKYSYSVYCSFAESQFDFHCS